MIYNNVHTGPKIQFGGFKPGLFNVAYQPSISPTVKNPLTLPTITQRKTQRISLVIFIITGYLLVYYILILI